MKRDLKDAKSSVAPVLQKLSKIDQQKQEVAEAGVKQALRENVEIAIKTTKLVTDIQHAKGTQTEFDTQEGGGASNSSLAQKTLMENEHATADLGAKVEQLQSNEAKLELDSLHRQVDTLQRQLIKLNEKPRDSKAMEEKIKTLTENLTNLNRSYSELQSLATDAEVGTILTSLA